jgi:predicted GH43/DUF377 family glycosyl hydrolase
MRSAARWALPALAALLAGCGRYADFELPPVPGPQPRAFVWDVAPQPVLGRGPAGAWDAGDVLNPSVVRFRDRYWNFYSGYDGRTWRTGAAESAGGVSWVKRGAVLSPEGWEGAYIAANGTTLVRGGELLHWYQAGDPVRIALARSSDGLAWRKHPQPVLLPGPRGSWDERGVADPWVVEAGGRLVLYYLGADRARRQRLGVAVSSDGVAWTKYRGNPVLELGERGAFDENGLGEPAVWAAHGAYWMLYTGRDRAEIRRIGLASSPDGVRWRRDSRAPVLTGPQPWNAKVVCDPSVEVLGDVIRVWFGGGDVAHPAENIHGQIGAAALQPRW